MSNSGPAPTLPAVTTPTYCVAVTGFPRCGSTMTMRMLAAGGLPTAPGADPGSHEHPEIEAALAAAQPGTVIKALDPIAWPAGPASLAGQWRIIWLDRNPRWQAESMRKFLHWATGHRMTTRETRKFRDSLILDRDRMLDLLTGHPLLTLAFEDTLRSPMAAAEQLAAFLPELDLDVPAMAAVVEAREPRTRPDMSTEERLGGAA